MPDLLLELFSEEIPARMQQGAARDLERLVVGALSERGLLFEAIKAFAGPRRLTLAVAGLPAKQSDVREELKGPKVDAPPAAIDGFLKKTGLSKDRLKIEKTPKGDVYLAVIERAGRLTAEVLAEILPEAMAKLPWPKSMRWKPNDSVRWVRPLHAILCTFDGEVVPFAFAGIKSGNATRGHRFLSKGEIAVRRYDDYANALYKAHVILDGEQRKAKIFEDIKAAAFVHGLELIPDEGLLNEVAGLAEWPVVLTGTIENQFMDVPAEILQTSMRTHQKYFSLRDPKTGKMASRFALVANMIAEDGGKEIVAGNERVLRARLSDAKFFWDEDRKHTLESRVEALKGIVFHAKLGTQYERVRQLEKLAGEIAGYIGANVEMAQRAARLSKSDLTTGIVGEFPELQGVMGSYYALHDNEGATVAAAIRDHYKPAGPNDALPFSKEAVAVALADKIDTLTGFFWIKEIPTGSKDPYALRRAALGVIRIVLDANLRLNLADLIMKAMWNRIERWDGSYDSVVLLGSVYESDELDEDGKSILKRDYKHVRSPDDLKEFALTDDYKEIAFIEGDAKGYQGEEFAEFFLTARTGYSDPFYAVSSLMEFFADRLKIVLKEKGIRHDLIDSVFSLGHEDDLVRLVARVEALQVFLKSDDGANLLAGYKRAANILKVEEKKDGKTYISEVNEGLLTEAAEKSLFAALARAQTAIVPALEKEDFAAAMRQMASLRAPVDTFFDAVKVNADDHKIRENRLHLLASFRAALHKVADFSKIEG